MPLVNNLPVEILYLIFKKLSHEEILDCQQVCRAWYAPAHITLLKNLEFLNTSAIEKFTTSLDSNPRPSYLNAVQKIEFNNLDNKGPPFSKEAISKIFFRFPNLKELRVIGSLTLFEEFNDEMCQEFLDKCAKLDIFEVKRLNLDHALSCNILYKLRNLVTIMNIVGPTVEEQFRTTLEFISKFPRLKEIHATPIDLANFEEILPVLYQLSDLTVFEAVCNGDIQNNFAVNYTPYQLERLSSIKKVRLFFRTDFYSNTSMFITKYMTGLKFLTLVAPCYGNWDDVKQQLFCASAVDLLSSIYEFNGCLRIRRAPEILTVFINQLTAAINTEHILELEVKDGVSVEDYSWLTFRRCQKNDACLFRLKIGKGLDFLQTASYLFKPTISLNKIKTFEVTIENRHDPIDAQETETSAYDEILRTMPNLEFVTLDIPEYIKTSKPADDSYTLNLVETLVLRATPDTKLQTLLARYFYIFPNLNFLCLCYYCGVWDQAIHGYRIDLIIYSLNWLSIDITPIIDKIIRSTNAKSLLIITVWVVGKNMLFPYSYEIDDLGVTFVHNDIWWEESICRENHHLLHIDINSLNILQICWNNGGSNDGNYCHNGMKHTHRISKYVNEEISEHFIV